MKKIPADELQAAIEAIVFVATEPVKRETLAALFPGESKEALEAAIEALVRAHDGPGRGLVVERVAGGLRLATRPELHHHVLRFVTAEKAERLSLRTLETLAVVAYKQPVTAAEVHEIRGVDPSGTLKTLLDRNLIKVVGRKKIVGRPFVYGTTTTFLTAFGLNDLSELPTLREIEDFGDLPVTDPASIEPAEPEDLDEPDEPDEPPEVEAPTERAVAAAQEGAGLGSEPAAEGKARKSRRGGRGGER